MRCVFVDPIGGAAGDMMLAALLDAGAPLPPIQQAIERIFPDRFQIALDTVRRDGLRAMRLRVTRRVRVAENRGGVRSFRELMNLVDRAALEPLVHDTARKILTRLGEGESRVHGEALASLTLHQLGEDDTLIDVVGISAALHALRVERLLVAPLPLAFGSSVGGPHGVLPLPAPATLELLRGFGAKGAENGELVTPTAAAVFAAVGVPADRLPPVSIESIGYGAGSGDRPNILRLLVGTLAEAQRLLEERELRVLETNLDDLAPQLVADAAETLRTEGGLDVWITPVQMKKGRSGVVLSALCEPHREAALRRLIFESTSTFGVRSLAVRRTELDRRLVDVALGTGRVRVKLGRLGDEVMSATPEHDDVAALAKQTGRSTRAVYEEAVAAARALREASSRPEEVASDD